jgi:predicted transport protein/predicted type IV restriction endonuclease
MASSLQSTVQKILERANQLREARQAGNEANTRALLIEPLLDALGWDTRDISVVSREFRVYDNTLLDYALKIAGQPKLFVEAKALSRKLDDPSFIAQTVNYANNEGVLWCVLTNGLILRVYKTNEPVPMDRKLLFEIDLSEAAEDQPTVMRSLGVLRRDSVAGGVLDEWGEKVFTDVRTRAALGKLATAGHNGLVKAVTEAMEGPPLERTRILASLRRIFGDIESTAGSTASVVGTPPVFVPDVEAASPIAGTAKAVAASRHSRPQYDLGHHTANKPSAIIELIERIDAIARAFGPDVERRIRKQVIAYFAGKSFMHVEPQKRKLEIYMSLPPSEVPNWDAEWMRDVSNVGHFGVGDLNLTVRSHDVLNRLEELARQSYLRNRR